MSRCYVGIDTSNYTTSVAVFDAKTMTFRSNVKRLLSVGEGRRGLRQSDAVFSHIKNLPSVTGEALSVLSNDDAAAVGVSVSPRDCEGSYMPCFLAGEAAASTLAFGAKLPLYGFSHQAGHVMAALWSSASRDLLEREFLSFHVSGGTTELLYVSATQNLRKLSADIGKITVASPMSIAKRGGTLDLNAGQVIDRTGVLLGCTFPCGAELEKYALANTETVSRSGVSVRGTECNLSGVENKVRKLVEDGRSREYIAAWVFDFIGRTIVKMTENAIGQYGDMPVVYAGGVMSNSIIKSMLRNCGVDARFAEPRFSSDNAAGTALLCAMMAEGTEFWKI